MRVVIAPSQLNAFEKKLKSLNNKAAKFGLEPIVASEPKSVEYVQRHEYDKDGVQIASYFVEYNSKIHALNPRAPRAVFLHIEVNGPLVKSGDWHVVAKLEKFGNENIIHTFSDNEAENLVAINVAKTNKIVCEHCGIDRYRKNSFVLADGNGKYKQVGSSCLKDFTGIDPAHALFLAKLFVSFKEFEEEGFSNFSNSDLVFGVVPLLAAAHFAIKKYGWVAKSVEDNNPLARSTCSDAIEILMENDKEFYEQYTLFEERAKRTIADFMNKPANNSFVVNAQVYIRAGVVAAKHAAMIVALAGMAAKNNALNEELPSNYVGSVGDRLKTNLRYVGYNFFETMYGLMYVVKFIDEQGNRFVWKTTAFKSHEMDGKEGTMMNIVGTVKEHSEYNQVK